MPPALRPVWSKLGGVFIQANCFWDSFRIQSRLCACRQFLKRFVPCASAGLFIDCASNRKRGEYLRKAFAWRNRAKRENKERNICDSLFVESHFCGAALVVNRRKIYLTSTIRRRTSRSPAGNNEGELNACDDPVFL